MKKQNYQKTSSFGNRWQEIKTQNYNLIRLSDFHINILLVCLSGEYVEEHNRRKKLGQTVDNSGETFLIFLAIGQNVNIRELANEGVKFLSFSGAW